MTKREAQKAERAAYQAGAVKVDTYQAGTAMVWSSTEKRFVQRTTSGLVIVLHDGNQVRGTDYASIMSAIGVPKMNKLAEDEPVHMEFKGSGR